VRAGKYGRKAGAIRITFDDAVGNGLFERVCAMQGKAPTEDGKRDWYTAIRAAYGPRKAAMREELDAIPRDGEGTAIPTVWIERAMPAETPPRPVIRWTFSDDFPGRPEREREAWMEREIALRLLPAVRAAIAAHPHAARWAVGMDYARHRHFSVIMPCAIGHDLHRHVPLLVELANAPARQQMQILWALLGALPRGRWTFAGDASGPGQTTMELTGDRFGRAVEIPDRPGAYRGGPIHEITLSRAWYGAHMGRFIQLHEDGTVSYPRDASLEDDLRAIEYVDGVAMIPRLERADLKDPELIRHGDGAIAGALMEFAASFPAGAADLSQIEIGDGAPSAGLRGYGTPADAGGEAPIARVGWGGVASGVVTW
jgi:phage FluMu gp28-like protein